MARLLLCMLLVGVCLAYNDDQPIYKWSPLWFNRYFRQASLFKRGDDLKTASNQDCVSDGRRCGYWGLTMPCCGVSQCLMDHCVSDLDLYAYHREED